MDNKDCLILETLFIEKNMKKTADRLFLTQPAVSYRIQKLEETYKVPIIVRGNKGIQFTPHGELLVSRAKKLSEEIKITSEMLEELVGEGGTIRLGVINLFSHYHLPGILKEFMEKYPKVKIKLKTGLGLDIMQYLNNDDVQIGIGSCSYRWEGQKILLREDPLVLISKEPLLISELPKYPMITFQTNMDIQKLQNEWWQSNFSVQPNVLIETDFVEICKKMVLEGLGYAIIPEFCLDNEKNLWTEKLLNNQGNPLYMKTWLNYRESSRNLKSVDHFIKFLISKTNE